AVAGQLGGDVVDVDRVAADRNPARDQGVLQALCEVERRVDDGDRPPDLLGSERDGAGNHERWAVDPSLDGDRSARSFRPRGFTRDDAIDQRVAGAGRDPDDGRIAGGDAWS